MPQGLGSESGAPTIPVISDEARFRIEALIDYISTSPENINYTMVREMLEAILTNNNHLYFDYYEAKLDEEYPESEEPIDPSI